MNYRLVIDRAAEKELRHLPAKTRTRVDARIMQLAGSPYQIGTRKVVDGDEFRVRVGSYRILYYVDDDTRTVTVAAVRHRKDAYK